MLKSPSAAVLDSAGNLYIADSGNNPIRKLTPSGTITTIAGNGLSGCSGNTCPTGDGGPASAQIGPVALALDSEGNLYIADFPINSVRKVTPSGTITTVAGGPVSALSGDGGSAAKTRLNGASGVALDAAGNLSIADGFTSIRKVDVQGIISTVAGTAKFGFSGDGGPATQASLNTPQGIAVDASDSLFIADTGNYRIRKITATGTISTIAGNGTAGFSGDGVALSAELNFPAGVAVDALGNVLVADTNNSRIRKILVGPVPASVSPLSLNFVATAGGVPPAAQLVNLSSTATALPFTVSSSASWLGVSSTAGSFPSIFEVTADPTNLQPNTYMGTILVTVPNAVPSTFAVSVTFTVQAGPAQPQLNVSSKRLNFAVIQGARTQFEQLLLLNTGSGVLPFAVAASAASSTSWLTVTPTAGSATPVSTVLLTVASKPASLSPGTYEGTVTITSGENRVEVPVTLSITAPAAVIMASQSGLDFIAVAGGGAPLPQTFGILNTGTGSMNWTVAASTLAGGNWLQISPDR